MNLSINTTKAWFKVQLLCWLFSFFLCSLLFFSAPFHLFLQSSSSAFSFFSDIVSPIFLLHFLFNFCLFCFLELVETVIEGMIWMTISNSHRQKSVFNNNNKNIWLYYYIMVVLSSVVHGLKQHCCILTRGSWKWRSSHFSVYDILLYAGVEDDLIQCISHNYPHTISLHQAAIVIFPNVWG